MLKVLRASRVIISLVILLFAVLVVWGIYTAMNSAASYTLSQSADPTSKPLDSGITGAITQTGASNNGVITGAVSSKTSEDVPVSAGTSDSTQTSSGGGGSSNSVPSEGSGSPAGGNIGSNSGGSSNNNSGSSNGNAPSTPAKTYHPAWDEWVVEGHWEDVYVAPTYGQRAAYGSICNDCLANISGVAVAHLKETHHSGYHEGIVGYEQYEITPGRTDRVWVDTSHWVHHPEYWD